MRILFVSPESPDDKISFLERLHSTEDRWYISWEQNREAGLGSLRRQERFHLVIIDSTWTDGSGLDFLRAARDISPETIRFLLVEEVDSATVSQQSGLVHRYLQRDARPELIYEAVTQVGTLIQLMENPDLRSVVSEIGSLPSIPANFQRVLDAVNDPETSLKDLGEMVAQDVSMTAQVLRFVNSAFLGLRHSVSSPEQAVVLLGMDITRSLITTLKILSTFQSTHTNQMAETLFGHSTWVSVCVQRIMADMYEREGWEQSLAKEAAKEEAMVAGMLHDVGKLILMTYLPEQYMQALHLSKQHQVSLHEAEYAMFGVSHAEIGGYWIGLCGLPDTIVQAVAFHHRPHHCDAAALPLLTAVHAGNVYTYHQRSQDEPDKQEAQSQTALDLDYLTEQGAVEHIEHWRRLCQEAMDEVRQGKKSPRNVSWHHNSGAETVWQQPDASGPPGQTTPLHKRLGRMVSSLFTPAG